MVVFCYRDQVDIRVVTMVPQVVDSTQDQVQCQVSHPWTQLDMLTISSSTIAGCSSRPSSTLSTPCRYNNTTHSTEVQGQGDLLEHLELLLDSFLLGKELLLSFSLLINILDMDPLHLSQGSR